MPTPAGFSRWCVLPLLGFATLVMREEIAAADARA